MLNKLLMHLLARRKGRILANKCETFTFNGNYWPASLPETKVCETVTEAFTTLLKQSPMAMLHNDSKIVTAILTPIIFDTKLLPVISYQENQN